MAKAILNSQTEPTPSEKIVKKPRPIFEVTDELGRLIKVRAPSYLERTDFIAALGEKSESVGYVNQALVALYVKEIDGVTINMPTRLSEVRAILQRLDDEGASAVIQCVLKNIIMPKEDEEKDKIKKS